jgi:hypothetical protein
MMVPALDLSAALQRVSPCRYASYLASSFLTTLAFHFLAVTTIHVVLVVPSVLLVVLAVAYALHARGIMPFPQCITLSTTAILLGFVARRLPSYLFDHPEDASTAQILTLHFLLAFIFISDVEWIRLCTIAGDLSVKYPDAANAPFQMLYRDWLLTQTPSDGWKKLLLFFFLPLFYYSSSFWLHRLTQLVLDIDTVPWDIWRTTWGLNSLYKTTNFKRQFVGVVMLQPVRLLNAFIFSWAATLFERREIGEVMLEAEKAEKPMPDYENSS